MTDHLSTYMDGRRRVHGRPGRLSLDIVTAAGQLSETMGITAGQKWARDLLAELRAADVPAVVIVELAAVPSLLDDIDIADDVKARIERAVVDAVAALTGNDE